ncbi:MAG: hypothetical protein IPP77_13050 [Bacteroidetes bacterium]|nr:hypothetical protein [Bacteroidota bacterium]
MAILSSKFLRFAIGLPILLISSAQPIMAQAGTLKGHIAEAGSDIPVEFANVILEGTTTGAISDERGILK